MIINDLTVRFDERIALRIDHLELERGASYAIIGHNGSGKSTLSRCIAGAINPTSGSIEFEPEDRIRYMPQHSYPFYGTTRKNILLGAQDKAQSQDRADELIKSLFLNKVAHASAKTLSGGETARMALARTLIDPGTWLVLDEPTSAFDIESTLVAEALIDRFRKQNDAGIILVTHSMKQAQRVCDRVVFLQDGLVVETGETAQCLANPQTAALQRFVEIFGS